MARRLAREIGYRYIDSGAMYRAVALYSLRQGYINDEGKPDVKAISRHLPEITISFLLMADGSQHTMLNGEDVEDEIRDMEVSRIVSVIAAIPEVRTAMVRQQRLLGAEGGIVMDGRDIGTTVFPDAELKIFVTASDEVRAGRRFKELTEKGEKVDFNEVLENVRQRDYLDEHREVSPLRKASDAILLDNTSMSPDAQNAMLLSLVKRHTEE